MVQQCNELQGDFLVHFMDIAREELNKKVHEISVEKLQVHFSPLEHNQKIRQSFLPLFNRYGLYLFAGI